MHKVGTVASCKLEFFLQDRMDAVRQVAKSHRLSCLAAVGARQATTFFPHFGGKYRISHTAMADMG